MTVNCHAGISLPTVFLLPRDKFARCRNRERGRGRVENADTVTWCRVNKWCERESTTAMGTGMYNL